MLVESRLTWSDIVLGPSILATGLGGAPRQYMRDLMASEKAFFACQLRSQSGPAGGMPVRGRPASRSVLGIPISDRRFSGLLADELQSARRAPKSPDRRLGIWFFQRRGGKRRRARHGSFCEHLHPAFGAFHSLASGQFRRLALPTLWLLFAVFWKRRQPRNCGPRR